MVFSWLHDFESANLCTNLDGMVAKCGQDYVCSDISFLLLFSKAYNYLNIYVGMSLFWRGGATASRDVWWFGKENYDNFFTRLPCWIMVGLRVSLFKHQVFWGSWNFAWKQIMHWTCWFWILQGSICIRICFWRAPTAKAELSHRNSLGSVDNSQNIDGRFYMTLLFISPYNLIRILVHISTHYTTYLSHV